MIIEKSVCNDCIWTDSCQKLHKLREMCGVRNSNDERQQDIFDVIVVKCSLKNFDRSYNGNKNRRSGGMYYCTECMSMHHVNSRIGKLHNRDIN